MNASTLAAPVDTASHADVVIDLDTADITVRVTGRVSFRTVARLRAHLLDLVIGGVAGLVVDLTGAELTDPTGAAALFYIHHVCSDRGVRMRVVVAPESVTDRVLRACGLRFLLGDPQVEQPAS